MNVSKTARKLYIHRNTVMFHFDKVKEKTGLDPRNFYDLIALVKMAKKGEKDD
jgi:DNA-binding PucR family transcriptional regulator